MRDKISHVLTARARVRGVGIEFLLQSCCCWCYVIQHVHHVLRIEFLLQSCCCWCYVIQHAHHVLHECVVGCPIISSTYEQVPINQHSVGIDFNCNHVSVGATSSNLCIIHCMNLSLHPCPDLSFDRLGLHTFLHSLRSNFSPSRPLQLCFEAACETSFARDISTMQSNPKAVEGATALFKNSNSN